MILEKFHKQPADVQDYDIDFSAWLSGFSTADTIASISSVTVDKTGLTIPTTMLSGSKVKVWTSGGTDGVDYKITARIITTAGRTNEQEIIVKVKEY